MPTIKASNMVVPNRPKNLRPADKLKIRECVETYTTSEDDSEYNASEGDSNDSDFSDGLDEGEITPSDDEKGVVAADTVPSADEETVVDVVEVARTHAKESDPVMVDDFVVVPGCGACGTGSCCPVKHPTTPETHNLDTIEEEPSPKRVALQKIAEGALASEDTSTPLPTEDAEVLPGNESVASE
jgi:hypothetical protein